MILTRSPYYYKVDFARFALSVDFTIEVENLNNILDPKTETYEITKQVPSELIFKTWIDISPLVRDLYSFSPISVTDYAVATVIKSNEIIDVTVTAKIKDSLGADISPTINKFVCADGYGYYYEGQNPEFGSRILLSHNEYKGYADGYFIVPLKVVSSDTAVVVNGSSVPINFVTGEVVKYLIVPLGLYTDNVQINFGGETVFIELIEECKYPVKDIHFINRFGVFESMHFYKAEKETLTVTSDEFKNNFTDGTSYDVQRHQIKQYNKKSNRKTRIETGFLNPSYNITLQELMQSENVWLDGKPINVTSDSLEFKTRSTDKLIGYSIDFEYAYDEMNNV